MGLTGTRTLVGFGFGAIQAGLFLYEAYRSGNFRRLVVSEVLPDLVSSLRQAEGFFWLNVAHADRIASVRVGPIEIYDPSVDADRERLISALASAQEIATAIPSVTYYRSDGEGSLHRLLSAGLQRKATRGGRTAVVYTAENDNSAAEILEAAVLGENLAAEHHGAGARMQFLNTVIGKMSGVISDLDTIVEHGLAAITPHGQRAFLVEAFNHILVSSIEIQPAGGQPAFRRGIEVFQEKADLLPFEEAKLYGHNATHALAAYVGRLAGARRIADLAAMPGAMAFLRDAFLQESGEALIRKHAGVDRLFTREGYALYADDLLERMTNAYLLDTVDRVGRDPARKLGWNDRLIGTMRLAMEYGVEPRRYAFGAAAALAALDRSILEQEQVAQAHLLPLWEDASPPKRERDAVLFRIETGLRQLRAWRRTGFGDWVHLLGREYRG